MNISEGGVSMQSGGALLWESENLGFFMLTLALISCVPFIHVTSSFWFIKWYIWVTSSLRSLLTPAVYAYYNNSHIYNY